MPNNKKLNPTQIQTLLTNLPPNGTIEFKKSSQGDIMLNNEPPKTKQQLIEENYANLVGQGISISDAAQECEIPRKAIENWVYISKYVSFVKKDCFPKLIDEAEVRLCAEIYKERKKAGTSGLPYFDDQGYIITEVKRPASTRK